MDDKGSVPRLERIRFFEGQRLTAADLAEIQAYHREMRWLHNRSLHAWGIGSGLGVTGPREARQVQVAPGYAVDSMGREIILLEPHVEEVPPVAGDNGKEAVYYLTVAYAGDRDLEPVETRKGVCTPGGAVRLPEKPRFAWRKWDEVFSGLVGQGLELILAKACVLNCRLNQDVSLEGRRDARPAQQPYVAAGQSAPGRTDWQAWTETEAGQTKMLGVETLVDTSSARFHATPFYLARVGGSRFFKQNNQLVLMDGWTSVVEATPNSFVLRVALPQQVQTTAASLNVVLEKSPDFFRVQLKWHVVWVGVEGESHAGKP